MVAWQIFLLIYIFFANAREFFSKKLVNKTDPSLAIFFVYLLAIPLFFMYRLLFFRESLFSFPWAFFFVGILWGVSTAAYFRALKISMSKSALFNPLSYVITIVLALVFLGEYKILNLNSLSGLTTMAGVSLSLISFWLLGKGVRRESTTNAKWAVYITINIIIFGLALFFSKYFLQNYSPIEGLLAQYAGGTVALAAINTLRGEKLTLSKENLKTALVTSIFATTAITLLYSALQAAPATIVIPAQSIGFVLGSVLMGLFLFGEKKHLNLGKTLAMIMGFVGIVLLLLS